ncbi:conserved hypothetical protein [Candidatus Terasakiella magnetica]|nr:conserved hypothetical protein [Candidatus Terasakiella magnetica]
MARRPISALAVLLAAALLSGCPENKPRLSLSEARAATDFTTRGGGEGRTPVSTFRSSADILGLLETEKPDPARITRLKEEAAALPPAGLSSSQAVAFYVQRGLAAGELGGLEQRIADLMTAAELSRTQQVGDRSRVLQELSKAQLRGGRFNDAIATRREEIAWIESTPSGLNGRLFGAYSFMTQISAKAGNFKEAEAWLGKLKQLYTRSRSWKSIDIFGPSWEASTLDAEAGLAAQAGRLVEAEKLFGELLAAIDRTIEATARWTPDQAPPAGNLEQWRDDRVAARAQVIARQGRLQEAENEMLQALGNQVKRRGRYAAETADMLRAYTELLLELGRGGEAETLGRIAVETYGQIGHRPDSTSLAAARVLVGRALTQLRRDRDSVALFREVEQGLANDPKRVERLVGGNASYAISLIRTGNPQQAVRVLETGLSMRVAAQGEDHVETAEIRGLLGAAKAAVGDRAGAMAAFKTSIPVLIQGVEAESVGGAPVRRMRTFRIILESYMGLLAEFGEQIQGMDVMAESFRIADTAQGSSVQQAIAANAARAAVRDADLSDLVRREQDGRQQLAALRSMLSELLGSPSGQTSPEIITATRRDIVTLDAAVTSLNGEIDRRFPAFADLMQPKAVSPAQIQSLLVPGEAMVLTYVGEDRIFAWAIPKTGAPVFAATPVERSELNGMIRSLRQQLDPETGTEITLDLAMAHRLYQLVLEPVAAGWRDAATLTVVPDKMLGQFPFAALVTKAGAKAQDGPGQPLFSGYASVPWLIRNMAVVQLPSASSLVALRGEGSVVTHAERAFIGFADPFFNLKQLAEAQVPHRATVRGANGRTISFVRRNLPDSRGLDTRSLARLPRLPDTAEEVSAIAQVLGADSADVVLGVAANTRTVQAMDLSNRRVVMFATHGLKAGDIDGLTQPALALSSPEVTHVGGSGLLSVDDVLGLKLNADWVVLSACNTAAPEGEGAEAISGLGRAFFYAGTRSVLVTSWAVETTSARLLTTETFRRVAADPKTSRGEALRQAMLAVMDSPGLRSASTGAIEFSYAHPMFWAPYVLVGDGRGN